jgi:hypothetical protein
MNDSQASEQRALMSASALYHATDSFRYSARYPVSSNLGYLLTLLPSRKVDREESGRVLWLTSSQRFPA